MNEIGGEVACFDALADFLASPETPFFHFVVVNVFAVQGFFRRFADSDVPANGSIPFAGEEFLCPAAFLEKNTAVPVGDMQVHYGMQQPACSVAFAPWRFADNLPLFVDKGKPFLILVCKFHKPKIIFCKRNVFSAYHQVPGADLLSGQSQTASAILGN